MEINVIGCISKQVTWVLLLYFATQLYKLHFHIYHYIFSFSICMYMDGVFLFGLFAAFGNWLQAWKFMFREIINRYPPWYYQNSTAHILNINYSIWHKFYNIPLMPDGNGNNCLVIPQTITYIADWCEGWSIIMYWCWHPTPKLVLLGYWESLHGTQMPAYITKSKWSLWSNEVITTSRNFFGISLSVHIFKSTSVGLCVNINP